MGGGDDIVVISFLPLERYALLFCETCHSTLQIIYEYGQPTVVMKICTLIAMR